MYRPCSCTPARSECASTQRRQANHISASFVIPDDRLRDKYAVDETEDQESRHSKATSSLTAVHESESLRLDKIHKTEKFENDKKIMKENHEQVSL